MKNIEEQLKELPEEFVVEMEQQKKDRWIDVYNFIVTLYQGVPIKPTSAKSFGLFRMI